MSKKLVVVMAAAMMMAVPALGIAAMAGANTVNSAAIVDGSIATADIANGAVTGVKIAAGAVGTSALASGAVTGSSIAAGAVGTTALATGSVTGTKLAAGAVGNVAIASGAVTDAKLSGIIGMDKIGAYTNTYVVHKGAANNVNTFNSVSAALSAISGGTGTYSGQRVAIMVMPGHYIDDYSILNDHSCDGLRQCTKKSLNVDIIGTSRTGSIIESTTQLFSSSSQGAMMMPVGIYFKNLTIASSVIIDHTQDSGLIGCDIKSNYTAVSAGWENLKNFTMEDVNVETPAGGYSGLVLYGNDSNDTLKFKNITFTNGNVVFVYPISTKPYSFSNITFKGDFPGQAFYILYGNMNAPSSTINIDNMAINGNYVNAIGVDASSNITFNVTNSQLPVTSALVTGTGSNNVVNVSNSALSTAATPTGTKVNIGNSKVSAILPSNGAINVVNSYNDNFTAYTNGPY